MLYNISILIIKLIITGRAGKLLIFAGLISATSTLYAQENNNNVVASSVPLLRINPDVRSAAMGETSVATSPDAASGMFNTSKSVFSDKKTSLTLNYAPWLRDITSGSYLLSAAGFHKLDDRQAITGSLRYFNSGKIEERDFNNNLTQLLTPVEFALDAGYARMLSEKLSVGVSFRFINSTIGKTISNSAGSASAFAADFSAYYTNIDNEGKGFSAGLVIANLGNGKMSYGDNNSNDGFLPARVALGAGYALPVDSENKLSFSGEINKSLVPLIPEGENGMKEFMDYSVFESYGKSLSNGAVSFGVGGEYNYKDFLFLRAGYYAESNSFGGRSFISTGAGVVYEGIGLNLGYIVPSGNGVKRNALANTIRIGLSFNFGN